MVGDAPTASARLQSPASGRRLAVFWDDGARRFELPARGELLIGRSPDCAIAIPHETVSRRHARLIIDEQVRIVDLGSSNGTVLQGARLSPNQPTLLPASLAVVLGNVLLIHEATVEAQRLPEEVESAAAVMPGSDFAALVAQARLFASSELPILITGETGTGKEVLAELVQRSSRRAGAPFVKLNCAALPESLLESELFGFERGAFTGAHHAKPGLLEAADGGTLLLDEVGDLPSALQAKLLRVLEGGEVLRLGANKPRKVDVRFIASTNVSIEERMSEGTFRPDLFFRLAGARLAIPPLRERRGEQRFLARRLLAGIAARAGRHGLELDETGLQRIEAHTWPGNVRELIRALERAVIVGQGPAIRDVDLELWPASPAAQSEPANRGAALRSDLKREEGKFIKAALSAASGNQAEAARLLGVSRRTLVRRLTELGLTRPRPTR